MKTEFRSSFLKAIKKIQDDNLKTDILQSILNVESVGEIKQIENLKKLTGHKNYYRIKIGTYRIGIQIESGVVVFVALAHRKNIYRVFPKSK